MKKQKVIQLVAVALLFLSALNMGAQAEFAQHMITDNFMQGYDVIAVDINRDGYPDIVAAAKATTGEVSWWRNNGFNEFEKTIIKQGFSGARGVRAADINGDTEIDIVAAGWLANKILYFENDGSENFTEHIVDNNFKGAHTVDLRDVNNDGYLDILCSGFDYYGHQGEIVWWENDGQDSVSWTKHLISDRFQQSPFIFGEDMDNDGDLDIVACGELNDEIVWWQNDGNQNFGSGIVVDNNFNAAHTVIARDVDQDGDMDILGAACMSSKIAWYENDGSQNFTKHSLPNFGGALWLDAIDLDNDGDKDLFGAGMTAPSLAWWENDGEQNFTKANIGGSFGQGFCVVPVMMDSDNDYDLVAIGKATNKISWFENKLEDPNPYNHPECCVYDYANERWLISNTGGTENPGYILEVDNEGNTSMFKSNIDAPLGMCIAENTLYVSDAKNGVLGFDLDTSEELFFMDFNPIGNMDGQAYDNDGHLFVVDTYGRIYKIYLEENYKTYFVLTGLTAYTQDIVFDEENNRLLAIGYATNAPIQAISLEDSSITNYPTSFSYYDGITMDQYGNVYLASHQSPGRVIKYFPGFDGSHEIVSTGHDEPAGLHYNTENDTLAVPNYGGSTVDFIPMETTSIGKLKKDVNEWLDIYPNPFHDVLKISMKKPCGDLSVALFNLMGQQVFHAILNQEDTQMNMQFIPSGIYIVKIKSDGLSEIKKIIKQQ
ncbi:MAG: hypothetical protein DRI89_08070 [Bacteroidetes bacterium]|nr:MAG: hypothetical protein DRI89_08070 [Bacteroidota bacterium]